jgi:hypothetical protein
MQIDLVFPRCDRSSVQRAKAVEIQDRRAATVRAEGIETMTRPCKQAYGERMFGRRDARAAAKWVRFAEHATNAGLTIVHVVDVYQVARSGTKALITVYGDHQARDAWFWWDRIETGATLAVTFSSGYGPHSHHDGVIFVGDQASGSGVHDRLSTNVLARAQRHQIRFKERHARLASEGEGATSTSVTSR